MHKSSIFLLITFSASILLAQNLHQRQRGNDFNSVRLPGPAISAMQKINPENMRAHVRFLSHDLLEGRGTGQRGGDIAAEYIATQFALYGLKPAGDHGTYMQKVPMVGVTTL